MESMKRKGDGEMHMSLASYSTHEQSGPFTVFINVDRHVEKFSMLDACSECSNYYQDINASLKFQSRAFVI
jgi:hypothetical protein